MKLLKSPSRSGATCPVCRQKMFPFDITDLSSGKVLMERPTTIFGAVYIQGGQEGVASYHLNEDESYISLDDNSAPPLKKPFLSQTYDPAIRTFRAIVDWTSVNFHGDAKWIYRMVFSEDFTRIESGEVIAYGPRFYGQNYSTMLEALFAVPLYRLGVPNYIALPIATSFFVLTPFVFLSWVTYIKKNATSAIIILTIPLLLSTEYSMSTSIPRGFVTGLFFASIGAISLFYNSNKWFFIFGFLMIFSYSVNPNSVIVSLPCLAYLFFLNFKNHKFYLFICSGIGVGFAIHYWINYFYVLNPANNIHYYELKYSLENLTKAINNLDSFYNWVSPIFWKNGYLYIVLSLVLGVFFLIKKKVALGVFFITIPFLLVLTTCFEKVHDGFDSVFFSKSRMYLGLPILIAISLSFLPKIKTKYLLPFLLLPVSFFSYKLSVLDESIIDHVDLTRPHIVSVSSIPTIHNICSELNQFSKKHGVDLIIIRNYPHHETINYGCETCEEDFPLTLIPSYERRTWRMHEFDKKAYNTILILGNDTGAYYPNAKEVKEHHFLLRNNKLNTFELLDSLNINYRRFHFD